MLFQKFEQLDMVPDLFHMLPRYCGMMYVMMAESVAEFKARPKTHLFNKYFLFSSFLLFCTTCFSEIAVDIFCIINCCYWLIYILHMSDKAF